MLCRSIRFCLLISLLFSLAAAQSSQPSGDAWPLYSQAIQCITLGDRANICSPAASSLEYADYPPYPAEWMRMETASYAFNVPARALVREARSRTTAYWLQLDAAGKIDMSYMNGCRNLANEVGDAALFQHLQGDDAGAIESVRDLRHLADLLDGPENKMIVQSLVALGVRMIADHRLDVITSDVALTDGPAESKKLQISTAKTLVGQLFDNEDPALRYAKFNLAQGDHTLIQLRRGQMENNLAAMSLACHVFRFEKHRWPASLEELTAYLPAVPHDAWGPMGYALVRRQPGNAERPLVYSHCNSRDGMFYSVSEPQYSWDPGLGSGDIRKQGGQFRDVTLWAPANPNPGPTTRPLE